MGNDSRDRLRDYPVSQNLYMYVRERTKGQVNTVVGPYKHSMSDTEDVVQWDDANKKFVVLDNPDYGIKPFIVAGEGEYVVLENPSSATSQFKHPKSGNSSNPQDLDMGKVIILHGPVSFAPWPMQVATVIPGHRMRSNQFLIVEITDPKQAADNWSAAFGLAGPPPKDIQDLVASSPGVHDQDSILAVNPRELTRGQRLVIRGTEMSFFMPVTGMEVIDDRDSVNNLPDGYVRDAVTLEQLEYCILLDESGAKDFPIGPDVVFPKPTQQFVEKDGSRVFRAMELTPTSGLHVKVTAPYKDNGKEIPAGTELFITGKEQAIYFPRKEHAIIDYNTVDASGNARREKVHYASAVPEGHGRYVLDKNTGHVSLVFGPQMLLLNPADKTMVQRVLTDRQVDLWFPGNLTAKDFNKGLQTGPTGLQSYSPTASNYSSDISPVSSRSRSNTLSTKPSGIADEFNRPTNFTAPKTIKLDDRFIGAVGIKIWPGYAIQIVGRTGKRRVEVGPRTVLLAFDEDLTSLALSTGKPKNSDKLFETVYLQITGNQVSDIVNVSTSDSVTVSVKVAYQVMFVDADTAWFTVSNYVKQVTDFFRSKLRGTVKQVDIQTFDKNAVDIIRDAVLGPKAADGSKRSGKLFTENNCYVYDVEVLSIKLDDPTIANIMTQNQQDVMRRALDASKTESELALTRRVEASKREVAKEKAMTTQVENECALIAEDCSEKALQRRLATSNRLETEKKVAEAAILRQVLSAELDRKELAEVSRRETQRLSNEALILKLEAEKLVAAQSAEIEIAKTTAQQEALEAQQEIAIAYMKEETESMKARLGSFTPEIAKALNVDSDNKTITVLAEKLGVAAYVKGDSLGATLSQMLSGTDIAEAGRRLLGAGK